MNNSSTTFPTTDPTPIFEYFRGNHATEILVASVCHLQLFDVLQGRPLDWDGLKEETQLEDRPLNVVVTALRAMGLLQKDYEGVYSPTALAAEHLGDFLDYGINGYIGLGADSPGVLSFLDQLRSNKPRGADDPETGTAFIIKEGTESAMQKGHEARDLTLSLAGRAMNVAPYLAARLGLSGTHTILDLGCGSGLYSIALAQKQPGLKSILMDSKEVLDVATEFAREHGVEGQIELLPGDMFTDQLPEADAVLLSNVLHDWDIPECIQLLKRAKEALPADGRLWIHDVFLDDELDGPLPLALYSASLFTLTEGRVYSAAEYRSMLKEAGFAVRGPIRPTLVHCGVMEAVLA